MTEAEAKTKWCPFARVVSSQVGTETVFPAANRAAIRHDSGALEFNANPESARCIGSACMAWRWTRDALKLDFDDLGPILRPDRGEALQGGCGLAGAPQ